MTGLFLNVYSSVKAKGRTCRRLKRKHNLNSANILETKEVIKQKVQLKALKDRRFEKGSKFHSKTRFLNLILKSFIRKWVKKRLLLKITQALKRLKGFGKTSGVVIN